MSSKIRKISGSVSVKFPEIRKDGQEQKNDVSTEIQPDGNGLFWTDPENIEPNPDETRKTYNEKEMQALTQSCIEYGILEPLIVRQEGERIILVAGSRRLLAAKRAKLRRIPIIITNKDPLVISLIENLQRVNLRPIEEARAYRHVLDSRNLRQKDLAQILGKSDSSISETLSLLKLPTSMMTKITESQLPKQIIIEICREKDPEIRERLFDSVTMISNTEFTERVNLKEIREIRKGLLLKPREPVFTQKLAGFAKIEKLEKRIVSFTNKLRAIKEDEAEYVLTRINELGQVCASIIDRIKELRQAQSADISKLS